MRSAGSIRDTIAVADIATPSRPGRLPGVAMAGFRASSPDLVEMSVVPYPAVTVFVDFGDGLFVAGAGGDPQRGSVVAGLAPGAVVRGRGRAIECLQVRLSPVVAHAALGVPVGPAVVTLDGLWGGDAACLKERLRAAASWDERFAIVETVLGARHESGRAVDPEVARAWRRLVHSRGRVRVAELAADTGWSRKRLWSRFRSQIGLTPKYAASLIRFDEAAHRLAAGHSAATVAAECGYADQSHLHRDVMAFAGVTPTAVAVAPWLDVDPVAWVGPGYLARV
ncbi:MAG TPA: helix-turn-helix domain-containing protein [Pseudonocardiaceae bacterium]|jgi:AraC-like DNA-binding protein|nr:helix-turn-helix domain-containing protein [Pseudonocardiaceae bacterium]